jgi:adenylosuccinate lyase
MMQREISPLDGRYRERLAELPAYFSEFALMKARCEVELAYLEALDRTGLFPALSDDERQRIEGARSSFSDADFERIVEIDREIDHDVKACELFLRERLRLSHPNLIHFGLTSADVNDLAYGLLLARFRDELQLPLLRRLIERLADLAEAWRDAVFPARTHGQPASPTTLGKELAVFLSRLLRQAGQLEAHRFRGKLTGATGTYASFVAAFPDHDWIAFSDALVERLGLEPNRCTTQIEDHDALAEYFAIVSRINNVVSDLDRDLWEYVSRGDVVEKPVEREVGSSTMPHKVNPIRFENSEGNVAISNALLHALSDKLTRSRMQRDLSDTTVKRNIGVALAHGHLAIGETLRGLDRIDVDRDALRAKVDASPEVLAEAIQTVLRVEGVEDPYELLRGLTRGKGLTLDRLRSFVDGLPVDGDVKDRLRDLRPTEYVGLASRICDRVVERARRWLER